MIFRYMHAADPAIIQLLGGAVLLLLLTLVAMAYLSRRKRLMHSAEQMRNLLQLQSVFDNLANGIIVLDVERNLVISNKAAVDLLGLPGKTALDQGFRDNYEVFSPDGQPLPREDWPSSLALRGKFLHRRELIIRRKDTQREIFVELSTTPIRNTAGDIIQVILSYCDMTERSMNTDARARLAAIVDCSEDAIIGKDTTGIIMSWNAAAQKIFGYTAEEMIGQSILRLLPEDRQAEEADFLDRIKRGEIIDHTETIRKTKDGRLIQVSLTISPIRDASGRVVGASKIARDITARKQLERQFQQSQKMEAIGQLTGGIAHDFNNLLCVIVGNLSLLERSITDEEFALKRLQTAQKAAARGADLTRRLLAFSSNEDLKPSQTILADSIRNTIELAARTLGPEIKIVAKLDENVPPVFVDSAGLESALLNLSVNARDAMPKGGTLTISSALKDLGKNYPPVQTGEMKPGHYACVSVTDTGHGMSRETMERALEPFFTTKPRGKGTGLGLAMVYGFIKQSGGAVRLYSEIGYGTTVDLYLPIADGAARSSKPQVLSRSADVKGCRVLVVDDEVDLLEIALAYLEELGCEAFQAVDGPSALKIVEQQKNIDLVITDVIMPGGMNGAELVEKIRQLNPAIKVIYSSGFPADALSERSGTIIDGVLLRKPYQKAEFDLLIQQTLANVSTE